jgi:N-acetylneuraminic acid mutarotase
MPAHRQPSRGCHRGRLCLSIAAILVAACTSGLPATVPPSAGRSGPPPSATVEPTSPAGPASPAVTSSPSPNATPARTEAPTATPAPTTVPSPATWTRAGSLDIANLAGPAVTLRGGRVLVTGTGEDYTTRIAALWDPATLRWRATTTLPAPRTQAAIVPLQDGRALVAGGFNGRKASYSSAYVFDPGAETWSKTGGMGTARAAAAAAVLPDGRVLVAGGYFYVEPAGAMSGIQLARAVPGATGGPVEPADVTPEEHGYALATAELFNPRTGTWSTTGPMRYARVGAVAVTLSDGRVLVFGSSNEAVDRIDARAYSNAEIYDPATGRFSLAGRLPAIDAAALSKPGKNPMPTGEPALGMVGTLVATGDGGAVLVGHSEYWKHMGSVTRSFRMDPGADWREIGPTWLIVGEPTADLLVGPATRDLATAAVAGVSGDRVLAAGGDDLTISGEGPGTWATAATRDSSLFDAPADRWRKAPALPAPVSGAWAVTLNDGSALLFGGWGNEQVGTRQTATYRYVPAVP